MKRNFDEVGKIIEFSKRNQADSDLFAMQFVKPPRIPSDGD